MLTHHPSIVKNGLVAYFDAANPKSYPAGQDSYVSGVNLLFDGEALTDKSAKTQTFTNNGTVTVSTTQKKFGNSSLYFSGRTADGGSNSYLSFAANSDFGFGTGNWTVETWFYKTTPLASLDVLFDNRVGLGGAGGYVSGVALYIQAGVVKTGNNAERLAGATIATGVWNHLMISRSGNNIYLGVNGTVVSAAFSTTLHSAPQLYVGNSVVNEYAGGYIDDYRVTKGFARYTANYTVPAGPNTLTGAVTDLTKNRAIATLTNGPTYSAGNIVLDGTNDYITIPASTAIDVSTNTTFEIWIKPSSTINNTGQSNLDVSFMRKQTSGAGFILEVYGSTGSNKQLAFWVNYPSGAATTYTLNANTWYQIVGTYNGSVCNLYVNGNLVATSSFSSSGQATSTPVDIGYFSSSRYFNGSVSMAKIYNKALTVSEVLQNYNATKSRYGY